MTWLIWLVAAMLLAVVEMISLDLIFIMLSGAALVALIPAIILPDAYVLQIVVFAFAALILLLALRPAALRRLHKGPAEGGDINLPVGELAVVLQEVNDHDGRVKLDGEVWSARPAHSGWVFPVGQPVRVVRIDGAVAIISPDQ